jgi:hypothetical protein
LADGVLSTGTGEAFVLVRDTLNVGISNIFLWAGTFLLVPNAFALSRDSTGIWQETEIHTGSLDTALCMLTFRVSSALNSLAFNLGVALQSLRAETHRAVVCHPALRRFSTASAFQKAGVLAFSCETEFLI